ncbi:DUF4192 domain-containing protein [Streptomyces sp. ACA25]|uniref:DUF4192 domain-containing protein n=1 Tax=Streptomyces sp. ACA25 TaxID=3022596 RepID=UPI002307A7D4|nr:DUF4192 domain-containing protein [Streptomyces sp. ACA25]MDB1088824.1 DUF4192 domain-containing protein [Streptomyces sp. ACA25]
MTRHTDSAQELTLADSRVILRGPAELADALPYLLGYHPDDSVVLVGLHGPRGRLGGRIRIGIPETPDDWPEAAEQLAGCLVEGSRARGLRPDAAVVYLCGGEGDPAEAQAAMERLRPLAQQLRTACGARDLPVYEALYLSGSRFWSYCCPGPQCCSGAGAELPPPGTTPMAAAAAFAGIRVAGSLKAMERRLTPLEGPAALRQVHAFDTAAATLVPRMLGAAGDVSAVRAETLRLAERLLGRFHRGAAPRAGRDARPSGPRSGGGAQERDDARDDALITSAEAAALILGLQDRTTRDMAAEWMEGARARQALRLWRALARRCVQAYRGHAAAPLTLAGWVAWSLGDEPAARVALGRAVETDPDYVFARLLHQALNDGLEAEPLRHCMRRQRALRGLGRNSAGRL